MLTRNQKRKLELIDINFQTNVHNNVLTKMPKLETNKMYANNLEVSEVESYSTESSIISSESDSDSNSESQLDLVSNLALSDSEEELDISDNNNEELDNDVKESESSQNGESDDNILKSFDNNISSILNGEFFNLYSNKYNIKLIKNKYSIKTIETLNKNLDLLRSKYLINDAEIDKILNMDIPQDIKLKALEKIYLITNSDILSDEYNYYVKELKEILYYSTSTELLSLDKQIRNILDKDNSGNLSMSYKNKILQSEMSFNNKVIAYKYMRIIESYTDQSSEELTKYKTWLNTLLTIPFNKYHNNQITYNSTLNEINEYLHTIRTLLDKKLSFLEYPKDQIINIITQLIRNPKSQINAIGMYGNKGIGKTHFVESISEALNRPLIRISLGGNSDVLTLKGHNFTYIGSKPGKIIEGLIKSKVMNPVIMFDEIDKISKSYHGSDINGLLIHLIDLTTNNKFNGDEYFSEIEFDLSRALFIFTYNDPNLIDPILADRLYKIKINNYTKEEKIQITTKHLINTILKEFNLTQDDIIISKDIITDIVNLSNDSGMRTIKNNIQIIISRLNTLLLTVPKNNVITLKYKTLHKYYNKLPIILKKEHINILLDSTNTNKEDSYLGLYT